MITGPQLIELSRVSGPERTEHRHPTIRERPASPRRIRAAVGGMLVALGERLGGVRAVPQDPCA